MAMNLTNEQIKDLLQTYLSGDISDEQLVQLKEWMEESPEHVQLVKLLEKTEDILPQFGEIYQIDETRAWNYIERVRTRRIARRYLSTALKYAAAILLFVAGWGAHKWHAVYQDKKITQYIQQVQPGNRGATLTLSTGQEVALEGGPEQQIVEQDGTVITVGEQLTYDEKPQETAPVFNTVNVPRGKEYSFALADGTNVWLNSESSITYPSQFGDSLREVTVSGEVYFEVEHDARRQFVVHTGDVAVKVYGTSFNVMSYEDEPAIETTLVEGSVQLVAGNRTIMLEPGMQALYNRSDGLMETRRVNTDAFTSWVRGTFSFENDDIATICRKLARWYSVDIEGQGSLKFSGEVKKYESFNELFNLIKLTNEIKIDLKDEKLTIITADHSDQS